METKQLLELRKKIKAKKPDFVRQDFHKKQGLKKKWRRPKGLQSKLRLNIRGKSKPVSQGYRSPKAVKGFHKSGLREKRITNGKDLVGLKPNIHGLIISSVLGKKKRIVILKKAKELGLRIVNIKNPDQYVKKIEEALMEKRKKKVEVKKKPKQKSDKEGKLPEKSEDKKESEKKDKDKLLTQRKR